MPFNTALALRIDTEVDALLEQIQEEAELLGSQPANWLTGSAVLPSARRESRPTETVRTHDGSSWALLLHGSRGRDNQA